MVKKRENKGVNKMKTSLNILRASLDTAKLAELPTNLNRISLFGEPKKELIKEESSPVLSFTRQTDQEPTEHLKKNNFKRLPKIKPATGLW
jgi:hypothetical protein